MIDGQLLKLLGNNKKCIYYVVALMVVGLLANISITACICYAIWLLTIGSDSFFYIYPFIGALVGIGMRYFTSKATGHYKDILGRRVKKDLRARAYNKIIKLGVRTTDDMNMAGLTQVSMEGVEQLDLYYSSYIPQFFYAMLAPIILFF